MRQLRIQNLSSLATQLAGYLTRVMYSPETCEVFWNAVPLVRSACNNNETYEKPFAVEAYAFQHLLDRYWRTWEVLEELTRAAALPLGKEGVRVMDVGTGPAPTPYAIADFYRALRQFGQENAIEELAGQHVELCVVERSPAMNRFLHAFSEFANRSGPFGADVADFANLNPPQERESFRQFLSRSEYYDPETKEYVSQYAPEEVDSIAQRHGRFRLVVLSNFLTLDETLRQFEPTLRALFSDLRSGSYVVVLGGKGNHYGKIYEALTALVRDCGFIALPEVPRILGKEKNLEAAKIIKICQNEVFRHLENTAGTRRIVRDSKHPDYWEREPHPKKQTKFSLHVFRKGKWPASSKPNQLLR
jgi:hypothetical protein